MKQRIPNGIYSKEFREQAVKQVQDEGLSAEVVAKRLSMPKSTLAAWVTAFRAGKLVDIGKNQRPLTELELELAKTKRELAEIKMERDLLKKAAAYFAKEVR
jgi:transposase